MSNYSKKINENKCFRFYNIIVVSFHFSVAPTELTKYKKSLNKVKDFLSDIFKLFNILLYPFFVSKDETPLNLLASKTVLLGFFVLLKV